MLKSSVMMIGELDYGDLFHPDNSASTNKLPYDLFSMIFFLGFLVVMPILIMNLLVRFREIRMFLPFSKKKNAIYKCGTLSHHLKCQK